MSQEHLIGDCDLYHVKIYNSATDKFSFLWVANAGYEDYTIFDIGTRVKDWMETHKIDGWIVGIKESRKIGLCIVAD
jgi:hypothetical protein